jgi:glycosyltransferase involved in cell wall biosynthesis
MPPAPLVSIILAVCNGEPFVADTLDSVLGQTYQNIEVIVVDDGSTDGTPAVVEACANRDSRVRVICQRNRGVSAARNRGLAVARGQFVATVDSDDLWDPTKIERQVRRMIEGGEHTGLIYCWWVCIDVNGAVLDWSPRWRIEGDGLETLLQVNYCGGASVHLFRRKWLEEIGGYDETREPCEDWEVALKVAERARVAVEPSVLVGYRRRPGSLSTRTERMWRSHALVMRSAKERRPDLSARLIRQSQEQFALYLAGVSFWSGTYGQAVGWGLRALPSSLALQTLPYVAGLFAKTLIRRGRPGRRVIRPGVSFSDWGMAEPLIPYDRIYDRRFGRLRRT